MMTTVQINRLYQAAWPISKTTCCSRLIDLTFLQTQTGDAIFRLIVRISQINAESD